MRGPLTYATLLITAVVSIHPSIEGLDKTAVSAGKLYFGSATDNPELTDVPYMKILNNTDNFGQLTPRHSMKWDAIEPYQDVFTFTGGDQIVDLAKENGQIMRGHNLVWYQRLPNWVANGTWTNETLTAALKTHVSTITGHYRGQLYAWDVINEPINDDGTGTLRSFIIPDTIGQEYIAIALHAAREADPTVKLYINDYNIEGPSIKSTAMINLVKSLKARGVPIDGIGVQAHLTVGELPSDIQPNLEAFTALGVEVAITELDIRITLPVTPQLIAQHKSDYETVIRACNAVKKCIGVTVWEYTDKYSWIPGTFPGQGAACPYDENLARKPAYDGIIAGFTKRK